MQTATTSELPTRQKEGDERGRRRRSESEADNDRATEERDRYVGRDRGRENERGRDACEAVSQHISNEHGE